MNDCGGWFCPHCNCQDEGDAVQCDRCYGGHGGMPHSHSTTSVTGDGVETTMTVEHTHPGGNEAHDHDDHHGEHGGKCEDTDTQDNPDANGNGCVPYSDDPSMCGNFNTDTFHAQKECCACGGGRSGGGDGGDCRPPQKFSEMKFNMKYMCSPCGDLINDIQIAMQMEQSETQMPGPAVCGAGGPVDKFKKGCPAKDWDDLMSMMEPEKGKGKPQTKAEIDSSYECMCAMPEGDDMCEATAVRSVAAFKASVEEGRCTDEGIVAMGMTKDDGTPMKVDEVVGQYACKCVVPGQKGETPTCEDLAAFKASDGCTDEAFGGMGYQKEDGTPMTKDDFADMYSYLNCGSG